MFFTLGACEDPSIDGFCAGCCDGLVVDDFKADLSGVFPPDVKDIAGDIWAGK